MKTRENQTSRFVQNSLFSVVKKTSQNNNTLAYNRYIGESKRYMTAKFTVIPHSGGAINR